MDGHAIDPSYVSWMHVLMIRRRKYRGPKGRKQPDQEGHVGEP